MNIIPRIVERFADPQRLRDAAGYGLHPGAIRVLANRSEASDLSPSWIMDTPLSGLDAPDTLPDVQRAATRVADAIRRGEVIGLETDHDVDGVTGHAVFFKALTQYFGHPAERIRSYIGLRLQEGYGISDSLCDRILEDSPCPSVIITADNGSSDQPRIARLKAAGIDVIVTDHHRLPVEGPPASAYACVSPVREDSEYPDKMIAGVAVAWLLMCAVRQELSRRGQDVPRLGGLLDFVAVGTVADCVSLARSRNNRAFVKAGLSLIEQSERHCWNALRPHLGDEAKPISASDLGFGVGPRINALGRLDDAMVAVRFLLSQNSQSAAQGVVALNEANLKRREIQTQLEEEAMHVAAAQVELGRNTLVVWLAKGHPGVHGIVASRLVEAFGRPAVCLSPSMGEPGVLSGSCRGVPGMNIGDALEQISGLHRGLLDKFGGHAAAGGLTMPESSYPTFEASFEAVVTKQLEGVRLGPVIHTDGDLDPSSINWALVDDLAKLEPYGREFDPALFTSALEVRELRSVGADGIHWKLRLSAGRKEFEAIWFGAGETRPVETGQTATFIYTPAANWWRGRRTLQLQVRGVVQ